MRHDQNSLDLLRLFAAWAVLFAHQYALLGMPEPQFLWVYGWGELGLAIFFFLSGALVWQSWCRDPHWGRFLARRSLRVFPALWVVVVLSVCVLGPLLTTLPLREYWLDSETLRYWRTGVLDNQKGLPGVFESNPLAKAINGSLWSLAVEFQAYLLVGVIGWCFLRWLRQAAYVLTLTTVLILVLYVGSKGYSKPHFEVLVLFGMGAAWSQWHDLADFRRWSLPAIMLLAVSLFLAFVYLDQGMRRAGLLLLTGMLVATASSVRWGSGLTDRIGDISYGTYIYAFPVQQTLVHFLPEATFSVHLLMASVISFGLGLLSWRYVEMPMLKKKPRGSIQPQMSPPVRP